MNGTDFVTPNMRTLFWWVALPLVILALIVGYIRIYDLLAMREPIPEEPLTTYRVQRGDSLWSIARRFYGDSVDLRDATRVLMERNGIRDPGRLEIGRILVIPDYLRGRKR